MYNYNKPLPKEKIVDSQLTIDWDLYTTLLEFRSHSESRVQIQFRDWLRSWIENNIPGIITSIDKYGNLYITKGSSDLYPCTVSHLDINQDIINDVEIIRTSQYIFGLDNTYGLQCGVGHDDKAGCMFSLLMLQHLEVVKCFFPLNEELGCCGTKQADMTFFQDCSMLVQLDRNSYHNDISEVTNGVTVVSEEFKTASKKIRKKYNYQYAHCMYTDIGELVKQKAGCVAMNISTGYFQEHSEVEILSIPHFTNAVHFGYELICSLGYEQQWIHTPKSEDIPVYKKYSAITKAEEREYKEQYIWEDVETPVWHHTIGYKFTKEDEEYIQDCVEIGECAICNSTSTVILDEGETVCLSCNSVFNIPEYKTLMDVEAELKDEQLDY